VRILIVSDWHEPTGGGERYVAWLRESLPALGHEVRLIAGGPPARRADADYIAYGPANLAGRAATQVVNPFAFMTIRSRLVRFQPDVVLVFGFLDHLSPAVLLALRGVPTVLSVIEYKLICPIGRKLRPDGSLCTERPGRICRSAGCVGLLHWLRDQPRYAAANAQLDSVAGVLACSEWLRDVLATHGIVSEALRTPVAPVAPSFERRPSAQPTFLFLGRLTPEKGVDTLLQAFSAVRAVHPSARLRIGGTGPEMARLASLAATLGIGSAVQFAGWLTQQEMDAELAAAWALVAPSRWAEPLGLVTVEANVRRVPVIATQTGGFAETVEPGAGGTLVPNGSVQRLARAMSDIASGHIFPDHLIPAAIAQRAAARHDLAAHTRELVRVLERARLSRSES
jgi:glycosyltransferase involved in cell wall biosynthesis